MYVIYGAYNIIYKYTQIGNRCILLYNIYVYNIHAIMKAICFPAHRSDGFVATHALGHINLSQHAFLESKAVLSFVRLLFFVEKKGILRFLSSNFVCIFWMLANPLQKIPMLVRLSFCKLLATHGLSVLSISYRE